MRDKLKILTLLAVGLTIVPLLGCGDDEGPGMTFVNPSTIRVVNDLEGPVLFFFARPCGTTDWGEDLLPSDPVNGTIQPGNSKDFTVEAGCYDLRAQHLETVDPGPLITKEIFDQTASPVSILTWRLSEGAPGGPS